MSYIYEALKRAQMDNESAGTIPRASVRRTAFFAGTSRWWLWIVSGVLIVNAIVLGAVIVRGRVTTAPVVADSPVNAPAAPVVEAPPPPPEITRPKDTPAPSPPRVPPASLALKAPLERPVARKAPAVGPSPAEPPSPPVPAPSVTLQVIVYSEVPSQRMVFIDGRRYGEGDAFDAETVLERITADGVVMKRRGQRVVISERRS